MTLIQFNSMYICVHINPEKAQQPRRRLSQYLFWWRVGGVAKHLARHINYSLYLCKYLCKFIEYIDNIDDITYPTAIPVKRYKTFSVYFSLVWCQGTEFNSHRCCICMGECSSRQGTVSKCLESVNILTIKPFIHELQTYLD